MNGKLFEVMLDYLRPKTLAYLARDLQDSQEYWQEYPDEAPVQVVKEELEHALEAIIKLGQELAIEDDLDFNKMIQHVRAEHQSGNWMWHRDRQEQQNWLQDFR